MKQTPVQRDREVLDLRQRNRDPVAGLHSIALQRTRDTDRPLGELRVRKSTRRPLDRHAIGVLAASEVDPERHPRNGNLGRPHKEFRFEHHLGLGR
jgi:hypothetical protein